MAGILCHDEAAADGRTLRDGFSCPYTRADARSFLDAWEALALTRMYALVFEWNTPSIRVLEKAGYVLEIRLPEHTLKDGTLVDRLVYAAMRQP